jgi:hypothetical protein
MDNDFIFADKFAEECAEGEIKPKGATHIDTVARTRVILKLIEVAIKSKKLKIVAPGKHGPVERLIQDGECGLAARDFRIRRSTGKAWFASDDEGAITTAPLQKQAAQGQRILELIHKKGFIPSALPKKVAGLRGVKAEVKELALLEAALFSSSSFDKAWERLRGTSEIADTK